MNAKKGNVCVLSVQFIVLLVVLNNVLPHPVSAQFRDVHSISIAENHDTPVTIKYPSFIHYSSVKYPDLLSYNSDSSAFFILKNNSKGIFGPPKMIMHTASITSVTVGNINDDGIDDIVIVHREQNQLELLISKRSDSSYTQSFFTVNFYPEQATIGDINNDRIPDVMSYGKLSSGISLLVGKGNGKFNPVRTLFDNIPVNNIALIGLNGDNITDIALHNWLTNETVLYLGLGRLKFSEQTVLSFGDDSVQTIFMDVNQDKLADVVVTSNKDRTLQVLVGDGLGSFSFSQAVPIYNIPAKIQSGSFVSGSEQDIVLSNVRSGTFSLFLSRNEGMFYDELLYGTETNTTDVLVDDINGDGLSDVVLFNGLENRYTIIWNSETSPQKDEDEVNYAVGLHPTNLAVIDIDGDAKDDLVVSNNGSSTISVLLSRSGHFAGQISLETPENPLAVSLYAKSDSTVTLYTIHQDSPKISMITLRKSADSVSTLMGDIEQFSISLPDKPTTVLPDASYMEKGISLYAFMTSATNSIMFYQQVIGTRFLTKSLVPIIPSKIIYSTINDLNADGKTDLLYVYSDVKTQANLLGVTLNDSAGNFKGRVYSIALPDTIVKKALMYIDDVNGDQIKDCLLYTSPNNSLRISFGNKDSLFGAFVPVVSNIDVRSPEQIQIYDFDNDGSYDLLYLDSRSNELILCRGKGNGRFLTGIRIADLPNGSVFRCGDFNGDNAADIAYTNPSGHTITVIYGSKK